jgi:hypothetical protein
VAARAMTGQRLIQLPHIEAELARINHGSTYRGLLFAKALLFHGIEAPQAGLHAPWAHRKFQLFLNGAPKQLRCKPLPRCKGRRLAQRPPAKSYLIISGQSSGHLRPKLDHHFTDQLFLLQISERPEFYTHHKRSTASELQNWKPITRGMRQ